MSTENTNHETTTEPAHKHGHPVKVTKEGVLFELCEFDAKSNNAGFMFYTKEFLTLDALKANLSDEIILMCVNRHYNFAMRQKASNSIPTDEEAREKQLREGKVLVITVEEAQAYKPGERDLTSLAGIGKRLADLREELIEARKEGDEAKVNALREQAKLLVAKQQDIINKDLGV